MDQPVQTPNSNLFELEIDQPVGVQLNEAGKWARFLGIIGMVFCALTACIGLFASTMLGALGGGGMDMMASSLGAGFMAVAFLIIAAIYFVPSLYLFRFGSQVRLAIKNNEQAKLQTSFKNLKACFRFMGILIIIAFGFYVLMFIVSIAGAAFM